MIFNPNYILALLEGNSTIFQQQLESAVETEYLWKPLPEKWCMLEVICHLYDEEREDFRARLKHVLENNINPFQPIDPVGWVKSRKYMEQNFRGMIAKFSNERKVSIEWLRSLKSPKWNLAYQHPKFGPMTGKLFLSNWLAHDYHHIRQILNLKYGYLKSVSEEPLDYAGKW